MPVALCLESSLHRVGQITFLSMGLFSVKSVVMSGTGSELNVVWSPKSPFPDLLDFRQERPSLFPLLHSDASLSNPPPPPPPPLFLGRVGPVFSLSTVPPIKQPFLQASFPFGSSQCTPHRRPAPSAYLAQCMARRCPCFSFRTFPFSLTNADYVSLFS